MTDVDAGNGPVVHGVLKARPLLGSGDAHWSLTWELGIVDGEALPERGGDVVVTPPGSTVTLVFAYDQPDRLLGLRIPVGTVTEQTLTGADGAGPTAMSANDTEWVSAVVGPDVVQAMSVSRPFSVPVGSDCAASWPELGRVAVASDIHRRTGRTLDGLWALDLAVHLGRVGPPSSSWREELLLRGATVGPLLGGLVEDPREAGASSTAGPLTTFLVRLRRAAPDLDLGDAIRRHLDELDEAVIREAEAASDHQQDERGRVRGEFLGPRDDVDTADLLVDRSARAAGVTGGRWSVDDDDLFVDVTFRPTIPLALRRHLSLRAFDPSGRLLASSPSLRSLSDGTSGARLPLPLRHGDDLVVVIGHDLPLDGGTLSWFEERQEMLEARERIDNERARGLSPTPPFLVETLAARHPRGKRVVPVELVEAAGPDTVDLARRTAAAKSLAAAFGEIGEAAEWALRAGLDAGADPDDLLFLARRAADLRLADVADGLADLAVAAFDAELDDGQLDDDQFE
jgi:hypothetical protein